MLRGLDELKFPDQCFPFDIRKCTEQILKPKGNRKKLYRNKHWLNYPTAKTPLDKRESKICEIFNSIGETIRKLEGFGTTLVRKWTTRFASPPVSTGTRLHQPDVSLMNTEYINENNANWPYFLGAVEITIGLDADHEDNTERLAHDTWYLFGCQPDRRFALGVSLVNSDMSLAVFNHGCLLVSDTFNIHEQPERLIRVVVGFMFANREYLGFDRKMELTAVDDECSYTVTVNSTIYTIEKVLYIEGGACGRSTTCHKMNRDGKTYVLKNAWVSKSHSTREYENLERLRGVENVTHLVGYGDVTLHDGTEDNTFVDVEQLLKLNRLTEEQLELAKGLGVRRQIRVVLSPLGRSLRDFRSRREVFRVLIDIVEGVYELCIQSA